jgi:hypothetical protein
MALATPVQPSNKAIKPTKDKYRVRSLKERPVPSFLLSMVS